MFLILILILLPCCALLLSAQAESWLHLSLPFHRALR